MAARSRGGGSGAWAVVARVAGLHWDSSRPPGRVAWSPRGKRGLLFLPCLRRSGCEARRGSRRPGCGVEGAVALVVEAARAGFGVVGGNVALVDQDGGGAVAPCVVELRGEVNILQPSKGPAQDIGRQPPRLAGVEQLPRGGGPRLRFRHRFIIGRRGRRLRRPGVFFASRKPSSTSARKS